MPEYFSTDRRAATGCSPSIETVTGSQFDATAEDPMEREERSERKGHKQFQLQHSGRRQALGPARGPA